MNQLVIHLVIGGFATFILIFNSILLLSHAIHDKTHASWAFFGFFIGLAIWAGASTLYPLASSETLAVRLYQIAVFMSYIAFFFMFVFSDIIMNDRINLWGAMYFAFLLGVIGLLLWIGNGLFFNMPYIEGFGYYAHAYPQFLLIQFLFIIPAGTLFIVAVYRMVAKSESKSVKNQTRLIYFGALVSIPGSMGALVIVELYFIPSLVLIVSALGGLVIVIAYAHNTHVAFVVSYQCQKIFLLNKARTPIFTHSFGKSDDQSEVLISGALSAIEVVMESALGEKAEIKLIKVGNSVLLVAFGDAFTGVLISNRESNLLHHALERFVQNAEENLTNFKESVQTLNGEILGKTEQYFENLFSFVLRR